MAKNSLSNLSFLINSLSMSLENLLDNQVKAIAVFQEILSNNSSITKSLEYKNVLSFICFIVDLLSESMKANEALNNAFKMDFKLPKRNSKQSRRNAGEQSEPSSP